LVITFVKNHTVSHYIIAKSQKTGRRIGSIKICSWDQGKSWLLYESLSCLNFNSGVSGSGGCVILTQDQLRISLSKFNYLRGEPENEIENTVSSSSSFKTAVRILWKALRAIGAKPCPEDIRTNPDIESLKDIERFLSLIQDKGEVLLIFT